MQPREGVIFRQLFHRKSCTYTYLLGSKRTREAILIDPVDEDVQKYLRLLRELDLHLVKTLDTHIHADHITGSKLLREQTKCMTILGNESKANNIGKRVRDGDVIEFDGGNIKCLHTPGHTDDSYTYEWENCLFTGDTLFIRGSGRCDFQHGSAKDQYDSIFNKILKYPDDTWIYPAHDYKGDTVSTVYEEKKFNPRLQVKNVDEYVTIMNNLNLPKPDLMDIAVKENQAVGINLNDDNYKKIIIDLNDVKLLYDQNDIIFIDLNTSTEYKHTPHIQSNHKDIISISYTKLRLLINKKDWNEIKHIIGIHNDNTIVIFFDFNGERSLLIANDLNDNNIKSKTFIGDIGELKKIISS